MWNWKTKNISIVVEPRRMKRLPKVSTSVQPSKNEPCHVNLGTDILKPIRLRINDYWKLCRWPMSLS